MTKPRLCVSRGDTVIGMYTYTTFEAERIGDNCADQMRANGWTLREKSPDGIHGGQRYLWVRPGNSSGSVGEFEVKP